MGSKKKRLQSEVQVSQKRSVKIGDMLPMELWLVDSRGSGDPDGKPWGSSLIYLEFDKNNQTKWLV